MFKMLCLIVAYVVVASVVMGYFVLESQNESTNTLQAIDYKGDLIKLDGSIPLNMFVNSALSTNNILFTTVENYGEMLKINPKYSAIGVFSPISNTVYFRGVEGDNNVYTVTYSIYNPDNTDFSIISAVTEENWLTGNFRLLITKFENVNSNNMQLIVRNVEDTSIDYAINSPIFTTTNINSYWISDGLNKITTVYDRNTNLFSLYLNDNLVVNNCPVNFGSDTITMYAGLRIEEDKPIYLESLASSVYLTEDNENSQNLLLIIAQLLAWNVDEKFVPNILNFILIKVPLIFLSIGLALYLRGVS